MLVVLKVVQWLDQSQVSESVKGDAITAFHNYDAITFVGL